MKLGALIFSLVLLTSCGGAEFHPRAAGSAASIPVRPATAAPQQWPEWYETTGAVRARTTVTVASKVMAYVQEVAVAAGDSVREGQILITLDSRDLEANLRRAEAARAEAQSATAEADNGVASAQANLDLAQSTFRRIEELAGKKSVSNQEFDEASARLRTAQAMLEIARSRRTQLDSRLAQADQEIRSAAVMRGYARITAPFAGLVTARSVEPGTLASPGAPLLTIEGGGIYRLEVSVDESQLPALRAGRAAAVSLDALQRKLDGRIAEVVPAVDAASRSYTVKIDLPAVAGVRSGMFGRASFQKGIRTVVAIPVAAVIERGHLQSVFVIEGGLAHSRMVTTGERRSGAVEVLSGVAAGEKVVAPVPDGLADGAPVEVRQ